MKNNLVAFTCESADGGASLWLIGPDGTRPRRIVVDGLSDTIFYPSWYPDGSRLAVVGFGVGSGGVVEQGQVTPYELNANHFVWSPDGRFLAFSVRHAESQNAVGIAIVEAQKL